MQHLEDKQVIQTIIWQMLFFFKLNKTENLIQDFVVFRATKDTAAQQ